MFFKKYGLSPLFLLILVVSSSFLKSVESISVVKKSPGILFFFSQFLEVKTYNLFYLILIFCIQTTSSFQLLHLIYFFLQYFFRYLILILFIVFLSYFLQVKSYNLFYFILIFCIQITSSFQLLYLLGFFIKYFLRQLFSLMVSFVSRSFGIFFLKNIVFVPCFFLFLQLDFHF